MEFLFFLFLSFFGDGYCKTFISAKQCQKTADSFPPSSAGVSLPFASFFSLNAMFGAGFWINMKPLRLRRSRRVEGSPMFAGYKSTATTSCSTLSLLDRQRAVVGE